MSDAQELQSESGRPSRRFSIRVSAGPLAESVAHVLVGHDTHPASQAAVSFAGDLAVRLGAHLHVAHVVELADTKVDPDSRGWGEAEQQAIDGLLEDARKLLADTGPEGLEWSYHAGTGDPVELLASLALENEVLFIVVGATERNFYRRLTEGRSVSSRLLRGYSKPVLVVPEPS